MAPPLTSRMTPVGSCFAVTTMTGVDALLGIRFAGDDAAGTAVPPAGRDAELRRTRSHLLVDPTVPRVRELPRAVLLYIPILVESGPADLERLLGEDDEILKSPSPLGAV